MITCLSNIEYSINKRMNVQELIEFADSVGMTLILMDGFDEAIVGLTNEDEPRVVYSEEKILDELNRILGSYEDALDYYGYNIASTYVGVQTPLIIRTQLD